MHYEHYIDKEEEPRDISPTIRDKRTARLCTNKSKGINSENRLGNDTVLPSRNFGDHVEKTRIRIASSIAENANVGHGNVPSGVCQRVSNGVRAVRHISAVLKGRKKSHAVLKPLSYFARRSPHRVSLYFLPRSSASYYE
jgi:hypothetical protein